MKKIISICLLVVTTFTVKAQDMSFEETVKYINEKIACCGYGSFSQFPKEANLGGDIEWFDGGRNSINLFDLVSVTTDEDHLLNNNGISLVKGYWNGQPGLFRIEFQKTKERSIVFHAFESQLDAERIYKALLHLKSLCTKKKDPFDK